MAQSVWVLSVDLQTKTATFQSGLADAARSARGAFTDIKNDANSMGRDVGVSMMEARHGVMLLGEEFGVHLPRALTTFIASIGPIGAAMEAAFPFLAIAVGATLLIEHLVKMREAGQKLTEDQVRFGTAVQNAFNSLEEKILTAGIRADELRNDHLGALQKQLELIDHQSMAELVHNFEEVAKAADVFLKDLEVSWYQAGAGSAGASHALEQFRLQYDDLLAHKRSGEASDLLAGTLQSAQKVLAAMHQMKVSPVQAGPGEDNSHAAYLKAEETLRAAGVGMTQKEVEAQMQLVDALQKQVQMEERVAELKKGESANAKTTTAHTLSAEASAAAREAADSQLRMGEQVVTGDRALADARMTIQRASIAERLASDIEFAARERDVQLAGNGALIAALDKSAPGYTNALKALGDKALEIGQQYDTKTAELSARASVEQNALDLANMEEGIRQQIEGTTKGTAAKLAAIDAGIRQERAMNMQDLAAFRELLTLRSKTAQQAAEEERAQQEQAGMQRAALFLQEGARELAALKEQIAVEDGLRLASAQREMAEEVQFANEDFAIKMVAYQKELAALDKYGKDYLNKVAELQAKEQALVQQHEDAVTTAQEKAEKKRDQDILSARQSFDNSIAQGLTQSIMGHETWAKMVTNLGNQVVGGMIENAIKSMLAEDMSKEKDAAYAARKAFDIGVNMGGPAGIVLGPAFGAAAFAAVMAFESGGIVPGVGSGDTVPAMLSPGEAVLPKGIVEGLENASRFGGSGAVTHVHIHAPIHMNASALDSGGVDEVFEKHSAKIQKHFENAVRKMNR
jgi:hypothetical protein